MNPQQIKEAFEAIRAAADMLRSLIATIDKAIRAISGDENITEFAPCPKDVKHGNFPIVDIINPVTGIKVRKVWCSVCNK